IHPSPLISVTKYSTNDVVMVHDCQTKHSGFGRDVKFGSCGGKGDINPWKLTLEDGGTFTKITILNTDDCIYSIRLKQDSPTYGGKTSSDTTETVRNHLHHNI
nr:hypothetical protein [Tanacetum cinerariifolium]